MLDVLFVSRIAGEGKEATHGRKEENSSTGHQGGGLCHAGNPDSDCQAEEGPGSFGSKHRPEFAQALDAHRPPGQRWPTSSRHVPAGKSGSAFKSRLAQRAGFLVSEANPTPIPLS